MQRSRYRPPELGQRSGLLVEATVRVDGHGDLDINVTGNLPDDVRGTPSGMDVHQARIGRSGGLEVCVWQASAGPVRVELSVRGGEQRTLNLHDAAALGALLTEAGRVTAGQSSRVTAA